MVCETILEETCTNSYLLQTGAHNVLMKGDSKIQLDESVSFIEIT